MKGYKTCACGAEVGCRTKKCPVCNDKFIFKPKSQRYITGEDIDDWTKLTKDNRVKIVSGSGPYMEVQGPHGVKRKYLGCKAGNYNIISLSKDGFFVRDGYTPVFVYMGEVKPGLVGIKEPHKVKLIR